MMDFIPAVLAILVVFAFVSLMAWGILNAIGDEVEKRVRRVIDEKFEDEDEEQQ